MLELIPISGALLTPILARGVPNKFIVKPVQCTYLYGLFSIAELPMAGAIKQSILTTVVQHLLSLDVEILWQDIAWSPGEPSLNRVILDSLKQLFIPQSLNNSD